MHDCLAVDVHDEEREDRAEPDVVGRHIVAGPDGMVAQESPPTLTKVRRSRPGASYVLLDRTL